MWPGGGTTDGFRSCSAQDGRSIRLLAGVVPLDGAGRVGGLAGLVGGGGSRVRVVVRSRCRWDCLTARPRGRCSCSPTVHRTAGQCWEFVVCYSSLDRSFSGSFVSSFIDGFRSARPHGRCSCSSSRRAAGRRGRLSSDWLGGF